MHWLLYSKRTVSLNFSSVVQTFSFRVQTTLASPSLLMFNLVVECKNMLKRGLGLNMIWQWEIRDLFQGMKMRKRWKLSFKTNASVVIHLVKYSPAATHYSMVDCLNYYGLNSTCVEWLQNRPTDSRIGFQTTSGYMGLVCSYFFD